MGVRRLFQYLICPFLLLSLLSGCQTLYRYRPVPILVQDADTKQPIHDATIRISYPLATPTLAPWESSATTPANGIARVQAAPYGDAGILVDATAKGYMPEQRALSLSFVEKLAPSHLFETVGLRPACYIVEMYAEPGPAVELIVPTGYRGTVKAEVELRDDIPCPPHQRVFRYSVSSSGFVKVAGPMLLRRVFIPDFRASYADGKPLPRDARDGEICFWWLKSEGKEHTFLVGTQSELAAHRPHFPVSDSDERPSGGGKRGGGGGGRGGRRGGNNPPPSDTSQP